MPLWNPWHGCRKISPGCANCYVYRIDALHGRDSMIVEKTASFDLPIQHKRDGSYRLDTNDTIFVCLSSDFFLEEADDMRPFAWKMIAERRDLRFTIITKRIHRFRIGLPENWGQQYDHVTILSTCEVQDRADYRLPILLNEPIFHRGIVCEPLLESLNLVPYLESGKIESVTVGGESGANARICRYDWVLSIRSQCANAGVPFHFKQTGANFEKDGRLYHMNHTLQQRQAARAGIDLPQRLWKP